VSGGEQQDPPQRPGVTDPREPDDAVASPRPRERVLHNTVSIVIARAGMVVFHVFAAAKQARHLGEKEWGRFGFLLSSMEVFRVLTNFGIDLAAIRRLAVGNRSPQQVVRHLLLIKVVLASCGVGAVLAASYILDSFAQNRGLLLLLAVGLYAIGFTNSLIVRFQAEHSMERLIPVQFIVGGLYLGAVYVACWRGLRVPGFIGVFVGYEFALLLLTFIAFKITWHGRVEAPAPRGFDRGLAWGVFSQGVPVGLLELIVVLYSRLGVFLLEHYVDLEAVGRYYIAIKVTEPLITVAGALSMSVYPVMSRLAEAGRGGEMRRRFARYSLRSALMSCALAGVLTLLAPRLLAVIRPEYATAASALIALAWAAAFMFQNQLSTSMINSFGKFHYVTGVAAANLCVYLCLGLWLIPRLGTLGAGLATLGTEGLNALIQLTLVLILLSRMVRSEGRPS
jgi:O-antigen/teichoic acid export membrane protein